MTKKNVFEELRDGFVDMDIRRVNGVLTRRLTPEELEIERQESIQFSRAIRDRVAIDEADIFRRTADASRKSEEIFGSFLNMHQPNVSLEATLERNPIDNITLMFIIQKAIRYGQSLKGSKGGNTKSKKNEELKKWALAERDTKNWPSNYKASVELAPQAIEKAKEFKTTLSQDRAQKTLYEWFRAADVK